MPLQSKRLPPFCILGGFIILAWRRNGAFAAAPAPAPEEQTAIDHG
jgi:hypothetical protein